MSHFTLKVGIFCFCCLLALAAYPQPITSQDRDHDGVADELEQELLEKFRPVFMISADDCDASPSEFVSGHKGPVAAERNGTIYGQVFRPASAAPDGAVLEIHFYHLWSKDCGRMSHSLDAEYVALLAQAKKAGQPASDWKATHWYAAAHEDTVCDTSSIAKATAIGAQEVGATVWVSWGKHASYFSPEQCTTGCGLDRCVSFVVLPPGKLINLGEPGFPLNGAEWASSGVWNLGRKMPSVFSSGIVAGLETPGPFDPLLTPRPLKEIQAVVFAVGTSLDSAEIGPEQASAAVSLAEAKTRKAFGLSLKKVRRSFRKAKQAFEKWTEKQDLF